MEKNEKQGLFTWILLFTKAISLLNIYLDSKGPGQPLQSDQGLYLQPVYSSVSAASISQDKALFPSKKC